MLTAIDDKDLEIVKATQAGLPFSRDPYGDIAATVGLTRDDLMQRLERMLAQRMIRRIGVVPNHYAIGYQANGMSVWDVDDNACRHLGEEIGALPFVSHCYRRPRHLPDWPYNLFAMIHATDRDAVEARVEEIAALLGASSRAHEVLYSTEILKKTGLRLRPDARR